MCEQITSKQFGTTYYRPVNGYKQWKATMRAPYRTTWRNPATPTWFLTCGNLEFT